MKILTTSIRLIIFLFFSELYTFSQVTADFSMSKQAGCTPVLEVDFTNMGSTGDSIKFSWDLGNGNHSSHENPSASYSIVGDHTVTLVVTDTVHNDSAIVSKTVTVYKAPTADFTVGTKGCVPYTANFMDNSQVGDAPISAWNWDFRDGNTSIHQDTIYIYNNTGTHEVFLQVTDDNGCQSSASKNIDVANKPVAGFTANPVTACDVPATIQFTNTSTGPGTLTYLWVFADGDSSQSASPSHIYDQFNNYNVHLQVTSDYGCSASTSSTISVNHVVAQGTLTQGGNAIQNNDVICPGSVNYESTSTGSSSVQWVFIGTGGGVSYNQSGVRPYGQSGDYKVLLIAAPGTDCADTISWNFSVEDAKADFTMDKTYSCASSVDVTFTDKSTNAASWKWTFQGGSTATTQNVTHTYSVPYNSDQYAINGDEYFVTTLEVTSANGCTSSSSKSLRIKKPTALFNVDTTMGCKSLTVNFNDVSLSDENITNREWIFDDGNTLNTTNNTASHTYISDNIYDSRLVITNSLGCTDTSYIIKVRVGRKLNPDFTLSSTNVCPNELMQFHDNTPESELIQKWHYFVNGSSIPSSPDNPDPYWNVDASPGNNDVTLIVDYNGCLSDTTKPAILYANGPSSAFTYNFSCDDPYVYNFTNLSTAATGFEWNFGDGQTDNSTMNPTHTYAKDSNYIVKLTTSNGGCSDISLKELKVRQPHASIYSDTIACANTPVIFHGDSSYSKLDYCFEKYFWDFDTIAKIRTNDDQVSVNFPSRGYFTGKLITMYDNECIDTAYQTIRIFQPFAGFTADKLLGCSPFDVNFMDTSKANVNPIESWSWNFSTGTDTSYLTKIDTINHLFDTPGTFPVTLTVTDTMGCIGTFAKTVSTANPNAQFVADKTEACVGDDIQFNYAYLAGDSVIWNFGDGTISRSMDNPLTHAFTTKGNYPVSLTVYENGCPDTYISPVDYIQLQKADASYLVSDSVWNCYPELVSFKYTPSDPVVDTLSYWEFGYNNNTGPYAKTPKFNYPYPGDYQSQLVVQTTFGCKDTAKKTISLSGPTGSFDIFPKGACRGDSITFSVKDTNNVYEFKWDMGNGVFLNGDPVKYVYAEMGDIYPKLLLYGDSGKCAPPPVTDTLHIYNVKAAFNYTDTALCDQYEIHFVNNSTGNDLNNWDFDNGISSTVTDPVEQFSTGNYTVSLRVANGFGCSDTLQKSFTIDPLPLLQLSNDTTICKGTSIVISATGGDLVYWSPAQGLSNPSVSTPDASPENNITYTAVIIDTTNACRNTGAINIAVQQPPDLSISPSDTTIIIGEVVKILADSSGEFSYNWSPDYQLSCSNCASPVAQPLHSTYYTLEVSDEHNCFNEMYNLNIDVTEAYSLELPSSFTPNGDHTNDVIYVKGWGIKKLIEFSVYNRWGNRIFFTDDLRQGWDGTYNGKPQNIDSYVYILKAEMWDGNIVEKKGTINLLK